MRQRVGRDQGDRASRPPGRRRNHGRPDQAMRRCARPGWTERAIQGDSLGGPRNVVECDQALAPPGPASSTVTGGKKMRLACLLDAFSAAATASPTSRSPRFVADDPRCPRAGGSDAIMEFRTRRGGGTRARAARRHHPFGTSPGHEVADEGCGARSDSSRTIAAHYASAGRSLVVRGCRRQRVWKLYGGFFFDIFCVSC